MTVAETLLEALSGLPWWGKWLSVLFIAVLPFIERRGALPAAVAVFDMPWLEAYLLSVIGNMIPVPFIFYLLPYVERFLRRWRIFQRFFDWLFKRTRKKGERSVQVWGNLALLLFVAIPLPMTGAWTGALIATLLKLRKLNSFLAILLGVMLAGVIVMVITVSHWVFGLIIIAAMVIALYLMGWAEERILRKRNTSGQGSHRKV